MMYLQRNVVTLAAVTGGTYTVLHAGSGGHMLAVSPDDTRLVQLQKQPLGFELDLNELSFGSPDPSNANNFLAKHLADICVIAAPGKGQLPSTLMAASKQQLNEDQMRIIFATRQSQQLALTGVLGVKPQQDVITTGPNRANPVLHQIGIVGRGCRVGDQSSQPTHPLALALGLPSGSNAVAVTARIKGLFKTAPQNLTFCPSRKWAGQPAITPPAEA